jgi:hypothetical protein
MDCIRHVYAHALCRICTHECLATNIRTVALSSQATVRRKKRNRAVGAKCNVAIWQRPVIGAAHDVPKRVAGAFPGPRTAQ